MCGKKAVKHYLSVEKEKYMKIWPLSNSIVHVIPNL